MLKILHTSDWHLGHKLYDHDRKEEQSNCMKQIIAIAAEKQPDAVVVSGDIFDSSSPSQTARELYIDTVKRLQAALPDRPIVVTAGNHDGKKQLNNDGALLQPFLEDGAESLHPNSIIVIGEVAKKDDGTIDFDHHIIDVMGDNGEVKGYIVAMPHVYEQGYPLVEGEKESDDRMKRFHEALLQRVEQRNVNGLPVVLMGHLYLVGSDTNGHEAAKYGEREIVGTCESVQQSRLGQGYDYLALGHIHRQQNVHGSNPLARYCGTPMAISFDEMYEHGVSIVTIDSHGAEPQVEQIAIDNIRPLETIPAEPRTFAEVLAEMMSYHNDRKSYVRLNVLNDGLLPADYNTTINNLFKDKQAIYCTMKLTSMDSKEDNDKSAVIHDFNPESMPTPVELAKMYFHNKYSNEMPDDLVTLLIDVVEEVKREQNSED